MVVHKKNGICIPVFNGLGTINAKFVEDAEAEGIDVRKAPFERVQEESSSSSTAAERGKSVCATMVDFHGTSIGVGTIEAKCSKVGGTVDRLKDKVR